MEIKFSWINHNFDIYNAKTMKNLVVWGTFEIYWYNIFAGQVSDSFFLISQGEKNESYTWLGRMLQ